MTWLCRGLDNGAKRAIERLEEVRTRVPLIIGAIYGSGESGKSLFIERIQEHFEKQCSVKEINVELAELNGTRRSYLSGNIPQEGIVFFPFSLNKCSKDGLCASEDPANYVKHLVPKTLHQEPQLDISIFIYNPRNYMHIRPKGDYDLIIENNIPKKRTSSSKQRELL